MSLRDRLFGSDDDHPTNHVVIDDTEKDSFIARNINDLDQRYNPDLIVDTDNDRAWIGYYNERTGTVREMTGRAFSYGENVPRTVFDFFEWKEIDLSDDVEVEVYPEAVVMNVSRHYRVETIGDSIITDTSFDHADITSLRRNKDLDLGNGGDDFKAIVNEYRDRLNV